MSSAHIIQCSGHARGISESQELHFIPISSPTRPSTHRYTGSRLSNRFSHRGLITFVTQASHTFVPCVNGSMPSSHSGTDRTRFIADILLVYPNKRGPQRFRTKLSTAVCRSLKHNKREQFARSAGVAWGFCVGAKRQSTPGLSYVPAGRFAARLGFVKKIYKRRK